MSFHLSRMTASIDCFNKSVKLLSLYYESVSYVRLDRSVIWIDSLNGIKAA
jgi:hypothetical protein